MQSHAARRQVALALALLVKGSLLEDWFQRLLLQLSSTKRSVWSWPRKFPKSYHQFLRNISFVTEVWKCQWNWFQNLLWDPWDTSHLPLKFRQLRWQGRYILNYLFLVGIKQFGKFGTNRLEPLLLQTLNLSKKLLQINFIILFYEIYAADIWDFGTFVPKLVRFWCSQVDLIQIMGLFRRLIDSSQNFFWQFWANKSLFDFVYMFKAYLHAIFFDVIMHDLRTVTLFLLNNI